ncbi:REPTOR-binding partner isoform X2 [Haemaphysalis longicornis]
MQMETDQYEFEYVKKERAEEESRGGRRGRRSSGSSVGSSSAAAAAGGRSSSGGKRGDMRAKLERSRQSARECRARKKLRYQYLEELVADREKAVLVLRNEYRQYFQQMDQGNIPEAVLQILAEEQQPAPSPHE